MPARSSGRSEPAAGREARPRRRDARRWYLRLHGWRILARRVRVQGGEVDIVARRGRTLAFVEVKARASDEAAAFALDRYRLSRVAVAAERLAPRFMRDGDDVRIDALFIVPGRWPQPSRQRLARVTKPATPRLGARPCRFASPFRWIRWKRSTSPAISTFALMLTAQARGHALYHYLADALTYAGRPPVRRRPRVSVQPSPAIISASASSRSSISAATSTSC